MEIPVIVLILLLVVALAIGAVVAWFIAFPRCKQVVESKYESLGKDAKKIIEDAEKEGQAQKKDLIREAKQEVSELKAKADKDIESKKAELQEESTTSSEVIFIDKGKIVLTSDTDTLRQKENASIDEIFRRMFKC